MLSANGASVPICMAISALGGSAAIVVATAAAVSAGASGANCLVAGSRLMAYCCSASDAREGARGSSAPSSAATIGINVPCSCMAAAGCLKSR